MQWGEWTTPYPGGHTSILRTVALDILNIDPPNRSGGGVEGRDWVEGGGPPLAPLTGGWGSGDVTSLKFKLLKTSYPPYKHVKSMLS